MGFSKQAANPLRDASEQGAAPHETPARAGRGQPAAPRTTPIFNAIFCGLSDLDANACIATAQ